MNLWGITVKPSPWWLAQGEILLVHSAQQARINTSDSGYFSQNKEELRAQRLQGPSRTPCKYFLTHWSYRLSMYCSLVWPTTWSEKPGVFIDVPLLKKNVWNRFVVCVLLNITLVTTMALPFSPSCLQAPKSIQSLEAVSASHTQSSGGVETCE